MPPRCPPPPRCASTIPPSATNNVIPRMSEVLVTFILLGLASSATCPVGKIVRAAAPCNIKALRIRDGEQFPSSTLWLLKSLGIHRLISGKSATPRGHSLTDEKLR